MTKKAYKMLVSYEMFHKEGGPHLITTGIDIPAKDIQFDNKIIINREEKYKDVAGFYCRSPNGSNKISSDDTDIMKQWVERMNKSLVYVEQSDKINGWLFSKDDTGKVSVQEMRVNTNNDINYELWIGTQESFFNPVDFLSDGDFFTEEDEDVNVLDGIFDRLDEIEEGQNILKDGFEELLVLLKDLITKVKK